MFLIYHRTNKLLTMPVLSTDMLCLQEGDVKKKIDSLLTSFRRERQKSKCYSGAGTEDVYKSNWFAFKHLQFLMDKFTPRKTIDSSSSVSKSNLLIRLLT